MNGFCGSLSLTDALAQNATLEVMLDSIQGLRHDSRGVVVSGRCGLGAWWSPQSGAVELPRQPFGVVFSPQISRATETGEAWIAFSGEMYNFGEIRNALVAQKHRFQTNSDVETVLRAYLQFGDQNFIKAFRGVFGLAIWNVKRRQLLLMRDRFGNAPLFYVQTQTQFIFSSNLQAVLNCQDVSRQVNREAFLHYLTYGYVPSPFTLIEGIHVLPPGHSLTIDVSGEGASIKLEAFWQPPIPDPAVELRDEDDISADLLAHIRWSTRLRLHYGGVAGVWLDGSIEAAALAGLAVQETGLAVKSFSLAGKDTFEQSRYSKQVAAHFVTDHYEVDFERGMEQLLDASISTANQPFSPASLLIVSVLNQIGSDVNYLLYPAGITQLFSGYDYIESLAGNLGSGWLPNIAQRMLSKTGNLTPAALLSPLSRQHQDWYKAHLNRVRSVPNDVLNMIIKGDINSLDQPAYEGYLAHVVERDLMSVLIGLSLRTILPDQIMNDLIISQSYDTPSIRTPFVDHQLVQFVCGIPSRMKLKDGTSRYIFKRALESVVPSRLLQRKVPEGRIDIGRWLRTTLRDMFLDTLASSGNFEIIDPGAVKHVWEEHQAGTKDHSSIIWRVCMFLLWKQRLRLG